MREDSKFEFSLFFCYNIYRVCRKGNKMFKELIDLYTDAIEDAQSIWLSDYCCSPKEAEERKKKTKKKLKSL